MNIDRRQFLRISGLSGAALVLGFQTQAAVTAARVVKLNEMKASSEVTPFVIIEKDGPVTIINQKPEMGQGTYQSIPSLIAEELEISLDQVLIRQAHGEDEFGNQTAGGSNSIKGSYWMLRKVGASAREMLLKAASQNWKVPVSECYADNGKVYHKPSMKSMTYNELAEAASKLEVPSEPKLKDAKDFKILGKSVHRPDIPLKVNGKAEFGIDSELPGMVFASVERSTVIGSTVISYDDSETMKVKGVLKTVKARRVLDGRHYEGVAVVADSYWAAYQGRKALKVQWDHQGLDKFDTAEYEQHLRDLSAKEGLVAHDSGNFDQAYADAPVKLEAFYETPVVSHSPMEPMNCLAHWKEDDTVEIWVSTQGAQRIKREVSGAFGIPRKNVIVNVQFAGGGFGRRLRNDFAVEAADISRKTGNKPVKVIWTREDDTQLGPFRPMTFSALKAGISSDGKALAFQHKVISPSMWATLSDDYDTSRVDESMVEGISMQAYEFPNMKNFWVYSELHIPMASWRSVGSSTLAFAHESFIDEMAVKAGKDPLAFRLELLTKDSDTKNVLLKLKEVSGWDKPLPKGRGRGIAQYEFFAGLCGHVVEVTKRDNGSIKIDKVYSVIDLGTVVNPDNVSAQIEGAIVMAITAATKDGIVFKNGSSNQSNFDNNRMLRINEMPEVEVHYLADGGPVIRGVGEPGIPPLAPALTNAIFAATGIRIRRLPFDLNNIS